ncbi:MAG: hypothetical protein ACYDAB_16205 [bacterium]
MDPVFVEPLPPDVPLDAPPDDPWLAPFEPDVPPGVPPDVPPEAPLDPPPFEPCSPGPDAPPPPPGAPEPPGPDPPPPGPVPVPTRSLIDTPVGKSPPMRNCAARRAATTIVSVCAATGAMRRCSAGGSDCAIELSHVV